MAAVDEGGAPAEHHVANCRRDPQLAVGRLLLDASRKVHGNTSDVTIVEKLDLTGMRANANRDADVGEGSEHVGAVPGRRRHRV